MKIWYLAHPVKSDDKYTTEQNLEHALIVQGLLFEAGVITIMPWHTYCTIYGAAEGERLATCLEMDAEMVKMTGRLILTGHRLSHGMAVEYEALNGELIDLIGVPDRFLSEVVHHILERKDG